MGSWGRNHSSPASNTRTRASLPFSPTPKASSHLAMPALNLQSSCLGFPSCHYCEVPPRAAESAADSTPSKACENRVLSFTTQEVSSAVGIQKNYSCRVRKLWGLQSRGGGSLSGPVAHSRKTWITCARSNPCQDIWKRSLNDTEPADP